MKRRIWPWALAVGLPVAFVAGIASTTLAHQDVEWVPGDGRYLVGEDIQPGTWHSGLPAGGASCMGRVEHAPEENPVARESYIDASSVRPQVMTIRASDVAFETSGCEPWVRLTDTDR